MSEENRYVAWFKTIGDPKWYTNEKVWDGYDRAFLHAKDKYMSWSQVEQVCAVREGVNPNQV